MQDKMEDTIHFLHVSVALACFYLTLMGFLEDDAGLHHLILCNQLNLTILDRLNLLLELDSRKADIEPDEELPRGHATLNRVH